MNVGVVRLTLHLPGARSLKDRRQVVRSFRDRVRARISASIAEVGDLDRHQVATLGVAVVGRDVRQCHEIVSTIVSLARRLPDAVLSDVATEFVPYGDGGRGVRGGVETLLGSEIGSHSDEDDDGR